MCTVFLALFQNVTVYSDDMLSDIAFIAFLILSVSFIAAVVISGLYQRKKIENQLKEADDSYEPAPAVVTKATVISKSAEYKYEGGMRYGKKITVYYMTFLKEDGGKVEFTVSEDMFNSFEVDDEGNLVTVEDIMLDFYKDEETEE